MGRKRGGKLYQSVFPRLFLLHFFLVAELPPKEVLSVHKISLTSCQRCRYSVEPRE